MDKSNSTVNRREFILGRSVNGTSTAGMSSGSGGGNPLLTQPPPNASQSTVFTTVVTPPDLKAPETSESTVLDSVIQSNETTSQTSSELHPARTKLGGAASTLLHNIEQSSGTILKELIKDQSDNSSSACSTPTRKQETAALALPLSALNVDQTTYVRRHTGTDDMEYDFSSLLDVEVETFSALFSKFDDGMTGSAQVDKVVGALQSLHIPEITGSDLRIAINAVKQKDLADTPSSEDSLISLALFLVVISKVKLVLPKQSWMRILTRAEVAGESVVKEECVDGPNPNDIVQESIAGASLWVCDSRWRWAYDALILIVVFYFAMCVPLQLLAEYPLQTYPSFVAMLPLDCLGTAVLLGDLYIKANQVVVRRNHIVLEKKKIRKALFTRKRFALEVIGALPFDLCCLEINSKWIFFCVVSLRLLNFVKLKQLFGFSGLGIVSSFHVNVKYGKVPLVKMLLASVLSVHIISCLYLLAACMDEVNDIVVAGSLTVDNTTVPIITREQSCFRGHPTLLQYQIAAYWSIYTLAAVGYGDIAITNVYSRMLAIVLFLIALVLNGWLIGKFTSYMMQLDVEGEHSMLMSRTLQVINHFGLEAEVVDDILSLQNHLLNQKVHLRSFSDVVERLPNSVQTVLHMYVRVEYLAQIPIFRATPSDCMIALAQSLLHSVYSRGEFVVVEGEDGEALTVLVHGFAHVTKNGEHVASLMRGTFFGEMSLLNGSQCCASVRCITYSECLILKKASFMAILSKFPLLRYHLEVVMCRRRGEPAPPHPYHRQRKASAHSASQEDLSYSRRRRQTRASLEDLSSVPPSIALEESSVKTDERRDRTSTTSPTDVQTEEKAFPTSPALATADPFLLNDKDEYSAWKKKRSSLGMSVDRFIKQKVLEVRAAKQFKLSSVQPDTPSRPVSSPLNLPTFNLPVTPPHTAGAAAGQPTFVHSHFGNSVCASHAEAPQHGAPHHGSSVQAGDLLHLIETRNISRGSTLDMELQDDVKSVRSVKVREKPEKRKSAQPPISDTGVWRRPGESELPFRIGGGMGMGVSGAVGSGSIEAMLRDLAEGQEKLSRRLAHLQETVEGSTPHLQDTIGTDEPFASFPNLAQARQQDKPHRGTLFFAGL